MRPGEESVRVVEEWLEEMGVGEEAEWSKARDWVLLRVPVGLAEDMLDTVCRLYTSDPQQALSLAYRRSTHGSIHRAARMPSAR